ncbi:MAG: hypothetical protein LJE68_08375 [Rhodobacter sp.]|nr:hypothetical protein [Rhodobacter sp.]
MIRALLTATALMAPLPAAALTVIECSGWQASARNIPEPWQSSTRTFANGEIRVTLLDTVEPAAGAFYLMVIAPPYNELGERNCGIVAEGDGGIGFAGMQFDQIRASYDPATGLTVWVPTRLYAPETGGFDDALLGVTINQASGTITPKFELP